MYMYSENQIQKATSLGAVLEPVMVKELQKWDLVFYENRIDEQRGDWMQFIRWTMYYDCHCHIDIKYTERRLKHIATMVDENGEEFKDKSLGSAYGMGAIHGLHKLTSMRYSGDEVYKYPTKTHITHVNYDIEGDPMYTQFYKDDIVFVLRNNPQDLDCMVSIDGNSEWEYMSHQFCDGLSDPRVFHDWVLKDVSKKCIRCDEMGVNSYSKQQKEGGYFGLIDWDSIWNNKVNQWVSDRERISRLLNKKDYTNETFTFQDEDCADLYYALKGLLNDKESKSLGTNATEVNTYEVMLKMLDMYCEKLTRFNEIYKLYQENKLTVDIWFNFYYGDNIKRKSRKVVNC